MGFEMRVLYALGRECLLVDRPRLRRSPTRYPDLIVDFGNDIALGIGDALFRALVMNDGSAIRDCERGIEYRGKNIVDHLEAAAAFFGGTLGFRDYGGDLLPDEPDDVVEHPRVVGVHHRMLMTRGREQTCPARRHESGRRGRRERASASFLSIETIFACGCGERSILICSNPSMAMSNV